MALFSFLAHSTSAGASNFHQNPSTSLVKVLTDHLGAATALTAKQKSEIREILAKGNGNKNFICTGGLKSLASNLLDPTCRSALF